MRKYYSLTNMKTFIFLIMGIFFFCGICAAAISSSENYKLHSGSADGGGMSTSSSSYSSRSSIGAPIVTSVVTGTNYKTYAGILSISNTLPEISILSYNDGTLTEDTTPTLSWSYTDKDGDSQRYYQVQISKDNFVTTVTDSGVIASSDKSYTPSILPTIESGITYRWRIRVNDGYGYSGWNVATNGFRVTTSKTEAPIVWAKESMTGGSISSSLWQSCATPYIYWQPPPLGTDIVGYSYAWGSMPDDKIDTTALFYQTPPDLLMDGIRIFNIKGQNTAGKWTDVVSFEIWIDRTNPIVGAYSPSNGIVISTDTPTISINVTDEQSGVNPDGILMKVNRSSVGASYDANTESVVYIPSIPLSEGDNVISLEVSDFVGNKTAPLVWSFIVDTKGPIGSIIINNQDVVTNSIYVNLTLSATDSTTGVKGMAISNDGVFDIEPWESFSIRKENWALPAISGTRKVYVKFKDNAGNESEIFTDTIELIIIAPDTIITSGPSSLTKSQEALFTFKASIEDCIFRWRFDDEDWSDWSKETSVRKDDLPEGNHYFKVQAAKDVNNNGKIEEDEVDPVPEERTWTISKEGRVKPEKPGKKPFRFWKEE